MSCTWPPKRLALKLCDMLVCLAAAGRTFKFARYRFQHESDRRWHMDVLAGIALRCGAAHHIWQRRTAKRNTRITNVNKAATAEGETAQSGEAIGADKPGDNETRHTSQRAESRSAQIISR